MMSGESPPSMTAFIAAAPATPGSLPPRSPVAYTFVAPNSPSPAAKLSASPATNAVTDELSSRALVSSSCVAVVGAPSTPWANTQTLDMAMFVSPPSCSLR